MNQMMNATVNTKSFPQNPWKTLNALASARSFTTRYSMDQQMYHKITISQNPQTTNSNHQPIPPHSLAQPDYPENGEWYGITQLTPSENMIICGWELRPLTIEAQNNFWNITTWLNPTNELVLNPKNTWIMTVRRYSKWKTRQSSILEKVSVCVKFNQTFQGLCHLSFLKPSNLGAWKALRDPGFKLCEPRVLREHDVSEGHFRKTVKIVGDVGVPLKQSQLASCGWKAGCGCAGSVLLCSIYLLCILQ